MKTFIISAFLLSLGPGALVAQTNAPATEIPRVPSPGDPAEGEAPSVQAFAAQAGAANLFAIGAAELALERSADDGAQALARQLLNEIGRAQDDLETAAEAQSVPFEPQLDAEQAQKLQAMRNAPADQFDNVFMSALMVAHQAAMEAVTLYGDKGEAGALKAWAVSYYPTLRNNYLKARAASTP